jgi:hypothetical protein
MSKALLKDGSNGRKTLVNSTRCTEEEADKVNTGGNTTEGGNI